MFAATKGVASPRLRTATFTSSTTWVAPAATNLITTASGYGGPATADYYAPSIGVATAAATTSSYLGAPNPPYGQWSDLYAVVTAAGNTIASNSGLNKRSFASLYYDVGPDDRYSTLNLYYDHWITGNTYSIVPFIGSPKTSGNVLYSDGTAFWVVYTAGYVLGSDGLSTTAFGRTFPGGTLSGSEPTRTTVAPTTTNFTNVAVTPGASYSIVVPSGGSLTITYIG